MTETSADIDRLAAILSQRFGHVAVRDNYGWGGNTALCVLDCVLSLNRRYDGFTLPRVKAFAAAHPDITELSHLRALLAAYPEVGQFSREHLNYNHAQREQTIRGVVDYLLAVGPGFAGATERECLTAWALAAKPADSAGVGVKGFGLAGFQYLRMLLGAQTTKPDVHIIRYVSQIVERPIGAWDALLLLEQAAAKAGLPLREVDGEIWQLAARPPELRGNPAGPG